MCGEVKMVDITGKNISIRIATAEGEIKLKRETIEKIVKGEVEKGDVISTAKIAAIMAAKRTPEIIPLCHQIPLTNVDVEVKVLDDERIKVETTVKTEAKTGVEMEAITATAIALITIWDMVKKYEKDEKGEYPQTEINRIRVTLKSKKEISL
ncbi:MAG: cyclic pyranopterin monophosphate synthase MoaC [archaeon YNP-LCB-003-016]|jgi:cyclic pyranopterin phosphate synthase|uniref:cyclic pyranopterin monophosphate synthase MoaC n=1 Tax=Candidatus Culexarchaeum yellowstonense TaxID=2928963 RepID=UPI0026F214BE|nr:cyclic pyranopterin monophosphate synthase MoaC [Candidatus Culexarchaeum yellowstonense]MCC6017475.1 cyclic pyranopterin monophosphate synthase MoaC [Candidatus Verstraetearchaeota archaeon]MCR6669206.1 cyclic pyranopterin monophosphate synthase MoaC [Candidatus Culexarchaeum yellowstonense]MCR6691227.1 cyclic pyranopterin monophosphate synthase MoaC [Candidatus Culexarchaeum yellowstonense]